MEIKTFKEGVAQLAAYTNQRQADPNPFALQFAKDSSVSLIAADESATIVWDIGFSDHVPGKHGVSSKMLYQASKVLKGKGNVGFSFGDDDLIVQIEGGGKITLPYGELPTFHHRPDKRYVPWIDQLDLSVMQKSLKAVLPTRENYVVATPVAPGVSVTTRLTASNGYTVWEAMTMPAEDTSEPLAFRIDALTNLKNVPKDSMISLGESSVRVESEDFTLYTRLLREDEFIHYPSLKLHHYPEGKRPPCTAEVDRNSLIGAIKAVAPSTKDQQFMMTAIDGMLKVAGIQTMNSVEVPIKAGWGTGFISLGAVYALPVLQALESSSILVVFGDPKAPVGFREKNKPYESFLVAPVWKS
jgi:DNA polymerase III sliding clamp (beta) subunit (PCNA family)